MASSTDLKIPLEEIEADLDAGKLDADMGRWFLGSRTGEQALLMLQQVLDATVTIESTGAPASFFLRYKPGMFGTLGVSDMGRIMRNVPAARKAFLLWFQQENYEWALGERERMAREAVERR